MKALGYVVTVSILILARGLFCAPAYADEAEPVANDAKEDAAEYASVVPMMDFSKVKSQENDRLKEITRSSKDATFVPCATEEECLRDLQEAQTAQEDSDKFQLVAEFVTLPKHGMFIYKQALAKAK